MLSVRPSVCLSVCLFVRLSIYLFVRLSICLSVRLSVSQDVCCALLRSVEYYVVLYSSERYGVVEQFNTIYCIKVY